MVTFTEVAALVPTAGSRLGEGATVERAQAVVQSMTDADAVAVLREAAEVAAHAEQLRVIAAGVIATRSRRDAGHTGLSQTRGHRTPVSLVQQITGATKAEAARHVRVGEALIGVDAAASAIPDVATPSSAAPLDWREPLRAAMRSGSLTSAQFDAIQRGLGEPPSADAADEDERSAADAIAHDAWMQAAQQLVAEATERTVEELTAAGRTIRDMLDPEGAEMRYLQRFERRSFRTWIDQDGMRRASLALDDEGGAFLDAILSSALRPRRGGPRFVDSDEAARAAQLTDDSRTMEQLSYDLLLDMLRAGVLAEPAEVFGTRQAGVRMVQVVDQAGVAGPVALTEDALSALPAATVQQHVCDAGIVPVTVDACGNPLDVGREQRLFTPRQRIALALRDGGCMWPGCDRPASYCEAHHIDEWAADGGRTDIDRGILLCRFHHMNLHHGGWRITREGRADFVLHHPDGEQFVLRRRAVLTYAWAGIDPPPKRFRPAAA
ncbi:DUF222 domain-containing protein [Microbacterium sp. NPDC058345]|uniref:HNH endonuclease signature motif containing protein n=1 Tax=Microbacterium sp. NPDC058345 TaxID=3346455 RepID=UPI00364713F9